MMTQTHTQEKFYLLQNDNFTSHPEAETVVDDFVSPQLAPGDTVLAEILELEELDEEETQLRLYLERRVERAFYEAGKALKELRDRRLYRNTHKSFEEYCRDRFGFTHRRINYLIAGSQIVENLQTGTNGSQTSIPETGTNGSQIPQNETGTNGSQILPTNERQIRPLIKLQPEQQRDAWKQAVDCAGGKVPSSRIVEDIVQRIMERTQVPNPYRVGEVCQLLPKNNPDLRGKGGYWCIVKQANNFSCTVTAWDGEYIVRLDHLKSLDYCDVDCQQMQEICDRITKLLQKENLEAAAVNVLQHLGQLKRPYLTPLEEQLLGVLEQNYATIT